MKNQVHHHQKKEKMKKDGYFDGLLGVFRERKQPNASGKGIYSSVRLLVLLNTTNHKLFVGGTFSSSCVSNDEADEI